MYGPQGLPTQFDPIGGFRGFKESFFGVSGWMTRGEAVCGEGRLKLMGEQSRMMLTGRPIILRGRDVPGEEGFGRKSWEEAYNQNRCIFIFTFFFIIFFFCFFF